MLEVARLRDACILLAGQHPSVISAYPFSPFPLKRYYPSHYFIIPRSSMQLQVIGATASTLAPGSSVILRRRGLRCRTVATGVPKVA